MQSVSGSTAGACGDVQPGCSPVLAVADLDVRGIADQLLGPALRIAGILLVAFVVAKVLLRLIDRVAERMVRRPGQAADEPGTSGRRKERAETLSGVLKAIASTTVWVLATLMVLAEVGINLAPLIAGLGIVGVALGFGAQNLVSDFVSGLFMLGEDQFGVGDFVDFDGTMGVVEHVGLRTTQVRSLDGMLWTVRNGEISKTGNGNKSWGRTVLDVGVPYSCDLRRAAEVIKAAADEVYANDELAEHFLEAPQVWGVNDLGDDAVAIRLVCTTAAGSQWKIGREFRLHVKEALDKADIEIPFPQRTIWLRTEPKTLSEPIPIVQKSSASS